MEAFAACFEGLEDPRTGNAGRHDLLEILMIALCTILCGGQTAVDMHVFGRAKEGFLRKFLKLEHGPPSHDTFSRVFRLLDPDQFRTCFQRFMARFGAKTRSGGPARQRDAIGFELHHRSATAGVWRSGTGQSISSGPWPR